MNILRDIRILRIPYEVFIGKIYNYSTVCYISYNSEHRSVGYYPDPESLKEYMSQLTYYVLRTPGATSVNSESHR